MHVFCRSFLVWLVTEWIYPLLRRVIEHAVFNPEHPASNSSTSDSRTCTSIDFPTLGWASLREARLKCPMFTVATMFLAETTRPFVFLKRATLKTLSWQYKHGIFFSAQCVPEMRSDRTYFFEDCCGYQWQERSREGFICSV